MKEDSTKKTPKLEDLLEHCENRYTLVTEAAKRARQITNFQKKLGEGAGGVAPLKIEDISRKPLTVSLEEIAEGKIEYESPVGQEKDSKIEEQ
ncbi:MAG: DNA-directed RNA polymerase subunit omega [Actinomycetota bacterium]|nr:DNA-directed RNA polymerase subunit omega [Actinomycetota bacterium]